MKNKDHITTDDLKRLFDKQGIRAQESFQMLRVEQNYGYQLLNGTRKPPREILLRSAIVLRLNLEETQQLLRLYNREILYPRIRYDAAIVYAITHSCSPEETDDILTQINQTPLFSER